MLGGDQFDCRKVGAVPRGVPCQQAVPADGGMSADIEVRKWGSSLAAAFAVDEEGLARNEARLKRKRLAFEVTGGNGVIEVLDPPEAGRDFGVHDRVDHQPTAVPGLG